MKKPSRSRKPAKPTKPKKLRCFFGLEFTLYGELAPLNDELHKLAEDEDSNLRISPAENLHITLKFLGSIPTSQLGAFESIMQQLGPRHESMQLHSRGLGCFKNSLWVGIEADAALNALVDELNSACALLGISAEHKSFVPHVTLARFGSKVKPKLLELIDKFDDTKWGEILVEKAQLYRSDTLPDGARYSVIGSYKLGGGQAAALDSQSD